MSHLDVPFTGLAMCQRGLLLEPNSIPYSHSFQFAILWVMHGSIIACFKPKIVATCVSISTVSKTILALRFQLLALHSLVNG